ncbi:MAG: DUF4928 family protein [Verrucomicrobia bacterium]|nr:DUF4928 family protein [Verrucomicrobiota bacterium]
MSCNHFRERAADRRLNSDGLLAEAQVIADRIDVFEIEQFIATNIHEISRFGRDSRKVTVEQLARKYNVIIETHETDPSLSLVIS